MLVFPVVKSKSDYTILGDVQRRDVERTIDSASKRDGVLRRRETDENEDDQRTTHGISLPVGLPNQSLAWK